MKLIGLTGGIGMGKSVALSFLTKRGIAAIDTDVLARQVVAPGQSALNAIRSEFGDSVIDAGGQLRRADLARIVFADPAARRRLEAIVHPQIRAAWKSQVETWKRENHRICVVAIPLLFETGAEAEFNAIVCAACGEASQQLRLSARGWSREEIHQRIQSQWPVAEKMARSNYVIWTEGSLDAHEEQLDRILDSIESTRF
jgi:dephospho-CoA kinase